MAIRFLRHRVALCTALAQAAALVASWPAAASDASAVLPHRAGYELELESVAPDRGVVGVSGALTYDLADRCDGWAIDQRYVLQIAREDSEPVQIVASYVNWEAKDGLRYRYSVKRTRSDGSQKETSEVAGEARVDRDSHAGTAEFEKPVRSSLELPAGTFFPTSHTLILLQKAAAGEKFDRRLVFDGSEVEPPSMMTAFFLPQRPHPPGGSPGVLTAAQPVWPVTVAVFPDGEAAELPSFEMTLYMQPDGVVPELVMNYGDFSVRGRLTLYEPQQRGRC